MYITYDILWLVTISSYTSKHIIIKDLIFKKFPQVNHDYKNYNRHVPLTILIEYILWLSYFHWCVFFLLNKKWLININLKSQFHHHRRNKSFSGPPTEHKLFYYIPAQWFFLSLCLAVYFNVPTVLITQPVCGCVHVRNDR